ncbi:MAG: hypothetical protein WBP16_10060 [Ferruginibacter sp.]
MKIEQLLVQHFFQAKELTLQGMGTFTLSPDFVMPKESDKDAQIPENAISFQYNLRATEDDDLINYIVQQTRKMKALASADLDSYLVLGKQFLNIGKPFKIEGLGLLVKNQQGEYTFTQGNTFAVRQESTIAELKDLKEEPQISFASENKTKPGSKKGLLIALIIIGLGMIGTTAWYFLVKKKNNAVPAATLIVAAQDSSKKEAPESDSTAIPKQESVPPADPYTFKVVFMVTSDSAAAVARMNVLKAREHNVIMYRKDSVYFKLAEPFTLPLTDTAYVKDSLNSFYYLGRAFIELN